MVPNFKIITLLLVPYFSKQKNPDFNQHDLRSKYELMITVLNKIKAVVLNQFSVKLYVVCKEIIINKD